MGEFVDLKAKPYNLSDEDIAWVEDTIATMSIEEKIGQLFISHNRNLDVDEAQEKISTYHYGGQRYKDAGSAARDVFDFTTGLREVSKIPMLVAANCDNGGDGACEEGVYVGSGAACEASGDENVSYGAGLVAGETCRAIGVNWNFDPCVDILYNWRNTIVNTRAYGTDADTVLKHTRAYLRGITENGLATCVKHFPGDGTEERDQHLVLGVNELSVEEWDESFGKVYSTLIEDGLHSIMVGHIALPEYSKKLRPEFTDDDIMPATLAPELLTDLLKGQLGWNGLTITDASHMIGFAAAMKRKDAVPRCIAAGCDMLLFFRDEDEDYESMMAGYRDGVITEERLTDALRRILGVKASIGLHRGEHVPTEEGLAVIGSEKHLEIARDAADKAITLVKNTADQLPIRPDTHPRIELRYLSMEEAGGIYAAGGALDMIKEELEAVGFQVTYAPGDMRIGGKVSDYVRDFDATFTFCDLRGYASENAYRIRWANPMSADIPWQVWEKPVVFIGLNWTTHLYDVPMVKTFINSYKNTREVVRQTIQKIMGESEFKGTPNELVWCGGLWEAKR
ncbi:MAG: glycoside hydrolase family 3 N-terminal domain-containing protein [Propionibacteriaceae bacterium]|nr:glycoside hydrolase family 3 N-terminal domain-containing protein [Propionibacteriaceae bacterium]